MWYTGLWKVISHFGEVYSLINTYKLSLRWTGFAQSSQEVFKSHQGKRILSLKKILSKFRKVEGSLEGTEGAEIG